MLILMIFNSIRLKGYGLKLGLFSKGKKLLKEYTRTTFLQYTCWQLKPIDMTRRC